MPANKVDLKRNQEKARAISTDPVEMFALIKELRSQLASERKRSEILEHKLREMRIKVERIKGDFLSILPTSRKRGKPPENKG